MTDEVSAAWVARKHTSYDELTSVGGALWWLQSDPDLEGARRLVRMAPDSVPQAQTPPDVSVGGWLHAYGGGSYAVGPDCQWIVSAIDSKVYRIGRQSSPQCVVPREDDFLYGDLHLVPEGLLAVRGTEDGDEIVSIGHGDTAVQVLISSTGFLASPRVRGGLLAYLEWDADRMPWDSSRLRIAEYRAGAADSASELVAGGVYESVIQPSWGPDGSLYFLSDRTGWWNLYRWNGPIHAVAPLAADCAPAPWEGGYQSYAFLPGGGIALTVLDGFRTRLITVEPGGSQTELKTELTSLKPYITAHGAELAVIGSTPFSSPSVRMLNPTERTRRTEDETSAAHRPQVAGPSVHETRQGHAVRYVLHLPSSRNSAMPTPLLVRAHPGPTDDVPLRLDWTVQFFTSRGFAVAEVAYRGSTGQGREFRQALHGHWGEYDVEDCVLVAEQLLADGVALPGAVFITGASAGGYTALQAACLRGPFTAATATSAIIDPERWTRTAPRFQRPHAAILAGPAGPIQAGRISVPVLLIHGTTDAVAPVSDAVELADQLAADAKDHQTLILDGVGHYLSDPASLQAALEAELAFYNRFIPAAG
ncbi:prolyl oligopeptidase family serine peptidase [Kitasatospora sp. NPDC092286]|uniref:alpha/beta hydrolase family protein n=1 Tax=Kitasatospora sp. NPDC092286 TaxID=3364087 RepID=UPI0037F16D1D